MFVHTHTHTHTEPQIFKWLMSDTKLCCCQQCEHLTQYVFSVMILVIGMLIAGANTIMTGSSKSTQHPRKW